jgi:hypothetical protein
MPVSVHIPKTVLESATRRARALRISRNRLIVRALERELAAETDWSPGFFDGLTPVDDVAARALDATVKSVQLRRKSKLAPAL